MYKYSDQEGAVYTHAPLSLQQRAVQFINDYVFATPSWLLDEEILSRIEEQGVTDRVSALQGYALRVMFYPERLLRVMENEALNGNQAYTMVSLFKDTRDGVFGDATSGRRIDPYRRNLQRLYIQKMQELMKLEENKVNSSDIKAITRANLNTLRKELQKAVKRSGDTTSRYHVQDLIARIDAILKVD